MMAVLFAFIAAAMTMIYLNKRNWSFIFLALGILFSLLMFYHHATDTLQINW